MPVVLEWCGRGVSAPFGVFPGGRTMTPRFESMRESDSSLLEVRAPCEDGVP